MLQSKHTVGGGGGAGGGAAAAQAAAVTAVAFLGPGLAGASGTGRAIGGRGRVRVDGVWIEGLASRGGSPRAEGGDAFQMQHRPTRVAQKLTQLTRLTRTSAVLQQYVRRAALTALDAFSRERCCPPVTGLVIANFGHGLWSDHSGPAAAATVAELKNFD